MNIDMIEKWCDLEFEVAFDSGPQGHVFDEVDTPGYSLEASPGSSRGQCFIFWNGGRLPNSAQKIIHPELESDGSTSLKSCFQIARVTRPLMSVGKICDSGLKVEFTDTKATVKAPDNIRSRPVARQVRGS